MNDALALAGQRAVTEATRLWNLDIYDPPHGDTRAHTPACLAIINAIIKANGWGDGHSYKGNGSPQWCTMFANYCWQAAGLDPRSAAAFWAGTMRLLAWARYEPWNEHKNPSPTDKADRRLIAELKPNRELPFEPREGDVVIVGDGSPKEGDHGTLCTSYNAARRTFETIAGNGGGVGPKGDRREGISRHDFAIDATSGFRAMFVIRPAFGDLLAERP